jgi:hypothetical protein
MMKMIKNIFISFLIFSLVNLYLPRVAFSQVGDIEEEITQNLPEMRSTPAENIPVETVKKSGKLWLWVLLGVVAVGAIVAVAASGGGGGGSSSSSSDRGSTGSVSVGW